VLPQLPTSALVPLVAPLTVPPDAGMAIGLLHPPPPGKRGGGRRRHRRA